MSGRTCSFKALWKGKNEAETFTNSSLNEVCAKSVSVLVGANICAKFMALSLRL